MCLKRLADDALRTIGSIYWAGINVKEQRVAPVEIDFHFPAAGSLDLARTVVRFSWLEYRAEILIVCASALRGDGSCLGNTATALAIELTPPSDM